MMPAPDIDTSLPAFLSRKLTPAERDAAWAAWPDKPVPRPPDPPSELELRIAESRERDRTATLQIVAELDTAERQRVGADLVARGFAKPGYVPAETKGTRTRARLLKALAE